MKALNVFGIEQNGVVVGKIVDHWVSSCNGEVLGFLFGTGLYALDGTHIGWVEDEMLLSSTGEVVATLQVSAVSSQPVFFTKHSERPRVPVLGPRSQKPAVGQQSLMTLWQLFGLPPIEQHAVSG